MSNKNTHQDIPSEPIVDPETIDHLYAGMGPSGEILADLAKQSVNDFANQDPIRHANGARMLKIMTASYLRTPEEREARQHLTPEQEAEDFMEDTPFAPEELSMGLATLIGELPGKEAHDLRDKFEISKIPSDNAAHKGEGVKSEEVDLTPEELTTVTRMADVALTVADELRDNVGNKYIRANYLLPLQIMGAIKESLIRDKIVGNETEAEELIQKTKTKFALQLQNTVQKNSAAMRKMNRDTKKFGTAEQSVSD